MQPHRIEGTSIIGRADDIDRLSECLERDRLISLVGPGGAGKTCLAAAVMTNVQGRFESGASFVDLAPADDHYSVVSALASELGISARPGKPLHDDLLDSIQSERRLLVLDNCEHVVVESAELVASLLRRCPGVVVLVTSRQLLDLHEEVRWHVGGLDRPDPADSDWFQKPLPSAVVFFVNRLRHVDPAFELDDSNAPDVAAICCELDGMPLAMELAAASSINHGLRDIVGRVRYSVLNLRSTDRDQDERHRSLQAVVDWSLGLLSSSERQLFTKLSTFSGEFTLAAASEVAGAADPSDTERAIGALVSKSLLERVVDGPHQRFRMLVPLRQSASELLPEKKIQRSAGSGTPPTTNDVSANSKSSFGTPVRRTCSTNSTKFTTRGEVLCVGRSTQLTQVPLATSAARWPGSGTCAATTSKVLPGLGPHLIWGVTSRRRRCRWR